MNSQLEKKSGSATKLVIDGENIPFGAYQAIYHKLTQKVEKLNKTYEDIYDIEFSDIKSLYDRLRQGLTQYKIANSRCEVVQAFEDSQSRSFSSFEKFQSADMTLRSCTSNLNFELDFLIILPAEIEEAQDIPQRYTLNVRVDQDFVEKPDPSLPRFLSRIRPHGKNIRFKLEYADYAVAQAIKALIDGWVDTLPTRKTPKLLRYIQDIRFDLMMRGPEFVRFLPFVVGTVGVLNGQITGISNIGALILFCLALSHVSSILFSFLLESLLDSLDRFSPITYLAFTNGDKERKETLKGKRVSFLKVISYSGLTIGTVIVNLLSAYIFQIFIG